MGSRVEKLSNYLIFNRGATGIRVSTYFAILQPKKYASISLLISSYLQTKTEEHPLLIKYINLLKGLASRV